MPAKKNPKAKDNNTARPKTQKKPRKQAARGRVQPEAAQRNQREREIDEDLAITFLTEYHVFEQALVRAGFTRAGRTPGSVQPDWVRFARHVEPHFKFASSDVLQGAVAYLLYKPAIAALRRERMEKSFPWEVAGPQNDMVWLSELVQQTRNRIALGINFPEIQPCEMATVMAALFVLEALSCVDPQVESMLGSAL